jgi:hypothetical protein
MGLMTRSGLLVGFVAAALAAGAAPASAGERPGPIVVELFTSQGCNSCPPADAYLGELAKRPDILALSWHVDYWDYIGWKDPFAQHAFTQRQHAYSRALAQRYVYTPQMVINGRLQGIGSERGEIERLIGEAKTEQTGAAAHAPRLSLVGDSVHIEGGPGGSSAAPSNVWIAIFDPQHWTAVEQGENAGQRLGEYNVVREWTQIGKYDGKPVTLKLGVDMGEYEKSGCAIVVQQQTPEGPGPILAAYAIDPPLKKK